MVLGKLMKKLLKTTENLTENNRIFMRPYDGFNGFEAEVFKAATGRGENNLLSDLSNRDQMIVLDLIESMKQRVG